MTNLRTANELDAAQRVIEADSSLMMMYQLTPQALSIRDRIREVFKSQIRHNDKQYAEFNRIRKELEDGEEKEAR